MLCFRYRKLLIPYSEGALDAASREKVRRHLRECEACASDLAAIQAVSIALRDAEEPVVEPAADLWARVSARIGDDGNRRLIPTRTWLRVPPALSAGAAAVLLAAIGFGVVRSDLQNAAPPSPPAVTKHRQVEQAPPEPSKLAFDSVAPVKSSDSAPARRGEAAIAPKSPAPPLAQAVAKRVVTDTRSSSERPKTEVAAKPTLEFGRALGKTGTRIADKPIERSESGYWKDSPTEKPAVSSTLARRPDDHRGLGVPAYSADVDETRSPTAGVVEGGTAGSEDGFVAAAPAAVGALSRVGDRPAGRDAVGRGNLSIGVGYACALKMETVPLPDSGKDEKSAVDVLNETEGIRTAALFSYP